MDLWLWLARAWVGTKQSSAQGLAGEAAQSGLGLVGPESRVGEGRSCATFQGCCELVVKAEIQCLLVPGMLGHRGKRGAGRNWISLSRGVQESPCPIHGTIEDRKAGQARQAAQRALPALIY